MLWSQAKTIFEIGVPVPESTRSESFLDIELIICRTNSEGFGWRYKKLVFFVDPGLNVCQFISKSSPRQKDPEEKGFNEQTNAKTMVTVMFLDSKVQQKFEFTTFGPLVNYRNEFPYKTHVGTGNIPLRHLWCQCSLPSPCYCNRYGSD